MGFVKVSITSLLRYGISKAVTFVSGEGSRIIVYIRGLRGPWLRSLGGSFIPDSM